ncbi:MAG: extracellular solute-binding protein [Chloroflexi bacterium]|nr:extracellular solute-binding protein [Chloroflexota bacterium]
MKRLSWVIAVIVAVLVVGACRVEERPAPAPETRAPGGTQPATREQEWDKVVAGARKEGKLTWYSFGGTLPRDAVAKILSERYGIELEYLVIRSAELFPRVVNERKAGLYIPDVLAGGPAAMVVNFKPAGYLDPIGSTVILPEAKDPAGWLWGGLKFVDKEPSTIISFIAKLENPIAINTDLVQPGEIKGYQDLLQPKWKGKIEMNDPTVEGTGLSWYSVVSQKLGLDYMRQLARQEVTFVIDHRIEMEWLARGKYAVLIGPQDGQFASFKDAGAPVGLLTPVEGTFLSSGGGSIALMNRAPHPNAARLFINWLLTREGQDLWQKSAMQQSARVDLPPGFTGTARKEGAAYMWISDEDTLLGKSKYGKEAAQVFGIVR